MISAAEEIKRIEKQKKSLEKLIELENEMNEKEKEYLKVKEKYETLMKKIYQATDTNNEEKL
jgi:hypothetical protein